MKKLLLAVTMALSLVSCSTDELGNGGGNASSKGVELVLSTDGFEQVGTRAISESVIQDVNILEFRNGACCKAVYLPSSTNDFSKAIKVTGLVDIPATTMKSATDADGNTIQVMDENSANFIFVIANYGSAINSEDVTHLSDLKSLKMDFANNQNVTKLPMTGFYYGGINTTATTQMNVSLQRSVAKINYTVNTSNFTVNDKTPSQIIVNSIKLCNVPSKITLYPCQNRPSLPTNGEAGKWSGDPSPFPSESEMASSVTYGDDDNQSTAANTFLAYIPENARGSYSNITTNKDKRPSNCGVSENNDKCFTYALVDLNYMTADGTEKKATYKIYLGGDANGDMNLLRNTQYNVTTYINGADANSTDTRISVNDVFTPGTVSGAQEAANCYMISMSGAAKTINIPLSQARRGWAWIANQTKSAADVSSLNALTAALNSGNYTIEQVWTTASANITGAKNTSNSKFATVTIPAGVTNGNNAVIALKIGGKTYWSWHLWFTDYNPATNNMKYASVAFQSGGRYASKAMMDRNLGATITGVAKITAQPTSNWAKYYGLFYQYGRKDPFLPADGTSTGDNKTQITVTGTATSIVTNGIALGTTVNNPTVFYAGGADWSTDAAGSDFWSANGVKSAFDPCPPGWRVPTGGDNAYYNPWAGFAAGDWTSTAYANPTNESVTPFKWQNRVSGDNTGNATNGVSSGRLYSNGGVSSWYPASGYRNSGSGAVNGVGYDGYYWSATSGRYLYFNSGYVNPANSNNRSYGFPVRCVQE